MEADAFVVSAFAIFVSKADFVFAFTVVFVHAAVFVYFCIRKQWL